MSLVPIVLVGLLFLWNLFKLRNRWLLKFRLLITVFLNYMIALFILQYMKIVLHDSTTTLFVRDLAHFNIMWWPLIGGILIVYFSITRLNKSRLFSGVVITIYIFILTVTYFPPNSRLTRTLNINTDAGGSVSPHGIRAYADGEIVGIIATAANNYQFTGWSGANATDLTTNMPTTVIVMNADKVIHAHFTPVTVNIATTGTVGSTTVPK